MTSGPPRQDALAPAARTSDQDIYEALSRGEYCIVLTPPEIGKLARVRAAARLRDEGVVVAALNLVSFTGCSTTEQWYAALLAELGMQLGLQSEMARFWREHQRLSALQRWMAAVREVAMERVIRTPNTSLIIFLEEMDAVQELPFSADEFFAAIREGYNRRTQDAEFHRLTFCLLGAVRLHDLIRDARTTVFNIGCRIELSELSGVDLVTPKPGLRHRRKVSILVKRAIDWISGEPYAFQTGDLRRVVALSRSLT